ncbi:hypothetical protein CC78DRAFT_133664 [Lojkania enalia]|uniref:Uncharacterized protein n=1 Tax=Lojkania enalia TaxID=147567 RepID=A0A9P4NC64_9PLEO|nr:hypothetical protein CC78DRAFT_133664 [Didymosphaeria enalia]
MLSMTRDQQPHICKHTISVSPPGAAECLSTVRQPLPLAAADMPGRLHDMLQSHVRTVLLDRHRSEGDIVCKRAIFNSANLHTDFWKSPARSIVAISVGPFSPPRQTSTPELQLLTRGPWHAVPSHCARVDELFDGHQSERHREDMVGDTKDYPGTLLFLPCHSSNRRPHFSHLMATSLPCNNCMLLPQITATARYIRDIAVFSYG